jgi:hypothetical protein
VPPEPGAAGAAQPAPVPPPAAPAGAEPAPPPPFAAPAAPAPAAPASPPPAAAAAAKPGDKTGEKAGDLMPDTTGAALTPPVEEPPVIAQVGVQRLPAYAYPEVSIRGLTHSSLWLTFHGVQWPYMPAFKNGERFVIGLSGWGWIDNSYQKFAPWGANPNLEQDRIKYWKQQARMLLRITPTYSLVQDYFIQGQVELVGTGDQTISRSDVGGADTDDLWFRIGQWNSWDVQFGRFEGWEVFHLGMGLDFNTFERKGAVGPGESDFGIAFYGLTDNQFRPNGAAGNAAVHYYPFPFLRFELLGMAGSLAGPAYATRPVGILDLGWFKLKLGTEYQHIGGQQASDQTSITSKGVGGAMQFVFAPHVEFGLNAAQGTVWDVDNAGRVNGKASLTRTTFGGFANVSNGNLRHNVIFGVGSMVTFTEDQNAITPNPVDKIWLYQGFIAAQYVLHNTYYVKLVGGYSRGHWSTAGNDPRVEFDNEMYSLRLRFSFYF